MDAYEILCQYLRGSMSANSAISELQKLLSNGNSKSAMQESAKARYAIGFIRCVLSYKKGFSSAMDFCMNLRDIILIFGRISLPLTLLNAVKECGKEFNLTLEADSTVTTALSLPYWVKPTSYVSEVYHLTPCMDDIDAASPGDQLLTTYTNFRSYKSFEQKLAIHSAIAMPEGHTMLVSQPTGGGKSLITQMLSAIGNGLTLVIVPTVALALDQYYAAKNNLINNTEIYCYRGEQTQSEKSAVLSALKANKVSLLFSSPEAIIKNNVLYSLLSDAAESGYLRNVVIDEAHIVPDWGVFFRPDFQVFSIALRKWLKISGFKIRTYMLSATLSDDVVDTLFSLFGTEGKNIEIRCDSLRQEPRFYFYAAKSKQEQAEKVLEVIRTFPKPMVVYVLEPKEAENLRKRLVEIGLKNVPTFTGKAKDTERGKVLQAWKNNEYDIVIATSAFGIGVDKPDVRTIVHACVPENLSRFYQEVGRAGRDRLSSISVLIPFQSNHGTEGDVRRALGLVNKRVLTVKKMVPRWAGLMNAVIMNGDVCTLDTAATPPTMTAEEADYVGNLNIAWNVNLLLFLYRSGYIDLLDTSFQPYSNSYLITIRLLKPEILSNYELLSESLIQPRDQELALQLKGYRIMRDLVQSPTRECWGHIFKELFPLAKEVCNGCPADPNGKSYSDAKFKLRSDPALNLEPATPNRKLRRKMGDYQDLIITRSHDTIELSELQRLTVLAQSFQIGVIVAPEKFAYDISFNGLVLTYDEFFFAAQHTSYLFFKGVICVFNNDTNTNFALYQALEKVGSLKYKRIVFCSDTAVSPTTGKLLTESIDGYHESIDEI